MAHTTDNITDPQPVIGFCSCPDRETALRIGRDLVECELAACINLIPAVESIYRWDDVLQHDQELLLVIKTDSGRVAAMTQRIVDTHPYELPEVITVPIEGGHRPYLEWITKTS